MPVPVIQGIAQRLQASDPTNTQDQREIFEQIRELRSTFDEPLDPESNRCLEAAGMLVAYLARMGALAGDDVRAIAVRLLTTAASLEEAARSGAAPLPAPLQSSSQAHKPHVIRMGQTAVSLSPGGEKPKTDEAAPPKRELSATELMGEMMLGQILLHRGQILEEHIHQAMKVQRVTGMRMGDVLVKIGAVTRAQVADALGYQASCRRVRENLGESEEDRIKRADTRGTGLKLMGEVLLGEILVERGVITRRQLEQALEVQKQTGVRVGEALVKVGAASMEHIEQALRIQGGDRKFSTKPAQPPGPSERKR